MTKKQIENVKQEWYFFHSVKTLAEYALEIQEENEALKDQLAMMTGAIRTWSQCECHTCEQCIGRLTRVLHPECEAQT